MLRALNQALCFHNRLNHNSEIAEVMGIKVRVNDFRCERCGKVVWGRAEPVGGNDD
ncbi:hypothetical protein ACRHK7_00400 [Weissella tructae]|uniref:hypothetical protein n=1 Tax=Weissella tructae TaxID=887702 RepID=UPI003D89B84A